MRLTIDHRTRYRFSEPQARLVQLLRMTPQNSHDQTIASWRIDVDHDARIRSARDGFGNATTMLYIEGPIDTIEISVTGEVLTSHSNGVLHGVAEPFPVDLFRRATAMTAADEAIADFAREAAGERAALGALHAINHAICARFAVIDARPDPRRTARDAFAIPELTVRDLAHVFIAAARSLSVPARYVSGYRHRPDATSAAPHGWAEAHIDGLGWTGFDPSTGRSPEEEYVRVAAALDAAGAAPVAGSRLGEGSEALAVDITVSADD